MSESTKPSRLMAIIQPIRKSVAYGRLGIFQLKYAGGKQRRKLMPEKTLNA
jgi:hypothetical protein